MKSGYILYVGSTVTHITVNFLVDDAPVELHIDSELKIIKLIFFIN